ncbi:hypothetical protein [Brevundimonas diminuta]|uniref:hypothetical protein n=1 Tax=Brevundimonas diminuta TaxID=293 RepID=UPI001F589E26|nr:hypothetical protein [Brevundimonas diminuta]
MILRLVIVAATLLFANGAHAQTFPEDDEYISHGRWAASEEGLGGSARTDSEGGWAGLTVGRMSSPTMNAIEFVYEFGTYDAEYVAAHRRFFGRNIAAQVSLNVDDQSFRPMSAIMEAADDGGLFVRMTFYDPSDETSPDVWENSCPVVAAISNARTISVTVPPETEGWLPLTGRGSSAALADVC